MPLSTHDEHTLEWRGVTITLIHTQYRSSAPEVDGLDAFKLTTTGAPLPMAHWDEQHDKIGFCADPPAVGDPCAYTLRYLDELALDNPEFAAARAKHIEAARQGELF